MIKEKFVQLTGIRISFSAFTNISFKSVNS